MIYLDQPFDLCRVSAGCQVNYAHSHTATATQWMSSWLNCFSMLRCRYFQIDCACCGYLVYRTMNSGYTCTSLNTTNSLCTCCPAFATRLSAKIESNVAPARGSCGFSGGRRAFWCEVVVLNAAPIVTRQYNKQYSPRALGCFTYWCDLHMASAKYEPAPYKPVKAATLVSNPLVTNISATSWLVPCQSQNSFSPASIVRAPLRNCVTLGASCSTTCTPQGLCRSRFCRLTLKVW